MPVTSFHPCRNVASRISSIDRHFEIKHQKLFKDDLNKNEAFEKAVYRYKKLGSVVKKSFADSRFKIHLF